jgi:putative transposase
MDWRVRTQRRQAINEPGHAHEFTFSCFRRLQFLKAERTCQWLADSIDEARRELNFLLWAYVFMPEHVHLIIYPQQPEYDVSLILKKVKEPVGRRAVKYLREHSPDSLQRISAQRGDRQVRQFWQPGGGYDRNACEPATILAMIEYIHLNPVRRGLVELAEQWKWSSAGWIAGKNSLRPDSVDFGGAVLFVDGKG